MERGARYGSFKAAENAAPRRVNSSAWVRGAEAGGDVFEICGEGGGEVADCGGVCRPRLDEEAVCGLALCKCGRGKGV
jgi:hypothetical protein